MYKSYTVASIYSGFFLFIDFIIRFISFAIGVHVVAQNITWVLIEFALLTVNLFVLQSQIKIYVKELRG